MIFMCNHCPYVKHVAAGLAQLARDYQARGVAVVGISSNDAAGYPADSPEQMVHEVENRGYTFPYLYDETQEVAKAYRAACTPDFFVFDKDQTTGLSRPDGFEPARFRHPGDGRRSACGLGCRARGQAVAGGAEAEHRLQYQMASRQRAGLFRACEESRRLRRGQVAATEWRVVRRSAIVRRRIFPMRRFCFFLGFLSASTSARIDAAEPPAPNDIMKRRQAGQQQHHPNHAEHAP